MGCSFWGPSHQGKISDFLRELILVAGLKYVDELIGRNAKLEEEHDQDRKEGKSEALRRFRKGV